MLLLPTMKTPYYSGEFTKAQHTDIQDDDQLRERMLEYRLANRDDVRDIHIVTALPFSERLRKNAVGPNLVDRISQNSKTDLSWAMHWAVQVGDQFFELQRGYPDPLRTGLRMSKWDQHKIDQIHHRYRQGVTAMTDDEIKAAGETHFSQLDRIGINTYDLWCNNCQIAVDNMLRDIGGLYYYRARLESLHEMVRQFFYDAILSIMKMFGRYRGWNEEIIDRYTHVLHKTLRVMTKRSKYPKRHWIKNDIEAAEGVLKKVGAVTDHWILSVLESSLSLRKDSEELYIHRGADGKPELNFDAVREATKGIFDDDQTDWRLGWLKAVPWLTAGFLVGTPRWAAAVISIALSRASHLYEDRVAGHVGIRGGLEESLVGSIVGLGASPQVQKTPPASSTRPKLQNQRTLTNAQKRVRLKNLPNESALVPRYERCFTNAGVPYFIDHMNKSRSWDVPDQQEMCLKIVDRPLSKKWEEKQEDGRTIYLNQRTGEMTDARPGAAEIWIVKRKVNSNWIKSTMMALPCGWEMRRTEEGEMCYVNHNNDPPTSTTLHPMRKEIEDERQVLLPEWNVEWDDERGKKYRNIQTGEIRWKSVDGPRYVSAGEKADTKMDVPKEGFVEPLPPGWTVVEQAGQKVFKNGKAGKERIERTRHPLADKRKRLQPYWEMRYTPGGRRYWVHYGTDGRGTTWWTRNRLLKNTSLKNSASGWKLAKNGHDWEWFEGGDVPHSDIPVLDLDDPADIEFREYPFVPPKPVTNDDGQFIEPLPSNWVVRTQEDGSMYYWNFRDDIRSEEHPNEEERRNLPALWEMRFTRHGRQYFVHHEDSSTWWTNPRQSKHEQKLRAPPGQSQNGWKLGEDGKTWERFEDQPNAQMTEQSMDSLSHTESVGSEASRDKTFAPLRSVSITRDWLKRVNSGDVVAIARTRVPHSKFFKRAEKSPSMASSLLESPREFADDEGLTQENWLVDASAMTEEPETTDKLRSTEERSSAGEPQYNDEPQSIIDSQFSKESEQELSLQKEENEKSSVLVRDLTEGIKASGKMPGVISSLINDLKVLVEERRPVIEEPLINTPPMSEEPQSNGESETASPPQKVGKRAWAKRTGSSFLSLRKVKGKKGSENGLTATDEKVVLENSLEPVVDGLGISTEASESGAGVEVSPRLVRKVDSKEVLGREESK